MVRAARACPTLLLAGCAAIVAVGVVGPRGRLPAAEPATAAAADESWQVMYVDEQRIGYSHSWTTIVPDGNRRILRTRSDEFMRVKRLGDTIEISTHLTTDETPDGEMLAFEVETRNPPAASTRTTGRVEGAWLQLETTVDGRSRRERVAWKPGTKSPAYADRLLQLDPLRPSQTRTFEAFEPVFNKITTVKLAADDVRPIKLLDGREERLLKVRMTKTVLPEVVTRAYVTPDGRSKKVETGIMGIVAYEVDRAAALEEIAGKELDLAVRNLIRVPAISKAHEARQIVYRVTARDADPARFLVAGPTQALKRIDGNSVELAVRAIEPAPVVRVEPVAAEYLQSSQYLQVSDPHVQEHARRAAGGETDSVKAALRMERYVFEKLKKKDFSTGLASAAEVARSLEGDCTEHALLLAALLRAQKIPSRIAAGLVYVERDSAFAGHMWTEAWLGNTWLPLDATRGRGRVGPAYIKQAESSFADSAASPATMFLPLVQSLDALQIEVLSVANK